MTDLSSFFDDVIEENCVETPVAVLKKLAEELTKKTKGMLVGDVKQIVTGNTQFKLEFYINVPSLNNYSFLVFTVLHDLGLYPLKVIELKGPAIPVENSDDIEIKLKQVFSSPDVKRVINGLLAQVKSA